MNVQTKPTGIQEMMEKFGDVLKFDGLESLKLLSTKESS